MSEESSKAWKKTEDIPRRFDELPPGPEWVPVADVIRTHREDTAKQEAKLHKIKPPEDSDSETQETKGKEEDRNKDGKGLRDKEEKKVTPKDSKRSSSPPTVDEVTDSMVQWALSSDHYPRRRPKPPVNYQEQSKPFSPLLGKQGHPKQERGYTSESSGVAKEGYGAYASPREGYKGGADITGSQNEPRTQGTRMKLTQSAGNPREHHPPYLEPNPDYEDEANDEYYPRNDDRYYDARPNERLYYSDYGYDDRYEERYDERYEEETYAYGSAYPYDERLPHDPNQRYVNPPDGYKYEYKYEYGDPEYEYGGPEYKYEYGGQEYQYEDQRGEYPQPQPYYDPMPQEHSRSQRPSRHDVLY